MISLISRLKSKYDLTSCFIFTLDWRNDFNKRLHKCKAVRINRCSGCCAPPPTYSANSRQTTKAVGGYGLHDHLWSWLDSIYAFYYICTAIDTNGYSL